MRHLGIYDKPELRKTVEGILYRMRVGCPWRDLPKYFGNWNSIFKKLNYWSVKGKLIQLFKLVSSEPDCEGFVAKQGQIC